MVSDGILIICGQEVGPMEINGNHKPPDIRMKTERLYIYFILYVDVDVVVLIHFWIGVIL